MTGPPLASTPPTGARDHQKTTVRLGQFAMTSSFVFLLVHLDVRRCSSLGRHPNRRSLRPVLQYEKRLDSEWRLSIVEETLEHTTNHAASALRVDRDVLPLSDVRAPASMKSHGPTRDNDQNSVRECNMNPSTWKGQSWLSATTHVSFRESDCCSLP